MKIFMFPASKFEGEHLLILQFEITFFEICNSGDRCINGPLLIILSQWFIHLTFDLWCTFWSCLKTFFRPVPFYIRQSVKVRPNRKNDL